MKTLLKSGKAGLANLTLASAIFVLVLAPRTNANGLKTVITVFAAGASAVGFEESDAQDELREAYKAQHGVDPLVSAVFKIEITLDEKADAVYSADTFGSADIFFVLEGSGNSSIAPFRHDGFKGGTVRHVLQGNAIQPGNGFALHLYDDDNVLNDVFSALQPKRVSPSVGILTPVGYLNGSIDVELQGGRVEINKPDYIGAITFNAPDDHDWRVSGEIQDQQGRKIGTFVVAQDSLAKLGAVRSRIGLFVGVAGMVVAVLVGLPLLRSKLRPGAVR